MSTTPDCSSLSTSSFIIIPEPWGKGHDIDAPFRDEQFSLFLYMMTNLGIFINCHLLKKELLWWGCKNALIYGYKNKNLGSSLLHHLTKQKHEVISYALGSHKFWAVNSNKHEFSLEEWTLNIPKMWSVSAITFMLLLYK